MAGFFPPEYQSFSHQPGDVFADLQDGKYGLTRILAVDRFDLRAGETISILNQPFTLPQDDFLLIIGCALGGPEFGSIEEAKAALRAGRWVPFMGHVPMRTTSLTPVHILIDSFAVSEGELEGYRYWRTEFAAGQAGIF